MMTTIIKTKPHIYRAWGTWCIMYAVKGGAKAHRLNMAALSFVRQRREGPCV